MTVTLEGKMKVKELIELLKKYDEIEQDIIVEVLGPPFLSEEGTILAEYNPIVGSFYGFDTLRLSSNTVGHLIDEEGD